MPAAIMSIPGQKASDLKQLRLAGQEALRRNEIDAASLIADELQQRFAQRPAGLVLRAQVARARQDPALALECYEACLTQFASELSSKWLYGKAWSLQQLGREQEATAVLHQLLAMPGQTEEAAVQLAGLSRPDDRPTAPASGSGALPHELAEPLRALILLSRTDPWDALAHFRAGPFAASDNHQVRMAGVWLAAYCDDMAYVRAALPSLIAGVDTVDQCTKLFPVITLALEGWDRTVAWLALQGRLHAVAPIAGTAAHHAARVLAMRMRIALDDHAGFLALHDETEPPAPDTDDSWGPRFDRLARVLRHRPFADHDAAKVFGIGLSRSGTTSLTAALDQLGFSAAHYVNDFTFDLLKPDDAFLYDALTDIPICRYFEALAYMFPNSRFIYTTRTMASWVASFNGHSRRYNGTDDFAALARQMQTPGSTRHGSRSAEHRVALYYRYGSAQAAREAFEARVFAFFAGARAAQLLVLDVSAPDALPTLCRFVERPVQDGPFPHRNQLSERR